MIKVYSGGKWNVRKVLKISARFFLVLGVVLFSLRPSLVNRVVPASWEPVQASSSTANHLEEKLPFAVSHAFLRCSFNREDKHQTLPVLVLSSLINLGELKPLFEDWSQTPTLAIAAPSIRSTVLRI
jgi:hypothetical protein